MWKKIAISSLILWIATVSFIGYKIKYGNSKVVDNRIQVTLTASERELVLGEMRHLLQGVQGIVAGLANNNLKEVEEAARGNGMVMAQDINPALMTKLPMEFKKVGIDVHESFDNLANEAHGQDTTKILRKVDTIMNSCVACHSTYKIIEKD